MNRHELATRNQALAEKRLSGRGPRGPLATLTSTPRRARARRQPERILALCPGGPDYALFATPALDALRAAYPLAKIAACVGLDSEPILRHNHEIDALHVVPALDEVAQPALSMHSIQVAHHTQAQTLLSPKGLDRHGCAGANR